MQILKQLFLAPYHFFQGLFMFSWQWRKQKKLSEEMDIKFHFKQKLKKRTIGMGVREKLLLGKELKKLSKKEKKFYVVYNYLVTVVYRARPGMTMRDGIKEFYDLFHPYFISYHSAFVDLKKILKAHKKGNIQSVDWASLANKYSDRRDICLHAENVLEAHKLAVKEVKKEEEDFTQTKKTKETNVDKKTLEIEKQILAERIEKDTELKKRLDDAIKSTPV